jgi:hypothetical protein
MQPFFRDVAKCILSSRFFFFPPLGTGVDILSQQFASIVALGSSKL